MNATEFTKKTPKPSNRRTGKAAREAQAPASSPDEIQADAHQPTELKKARSRTPARGKKSRPPAKKDRLVELLRREDGATIEELMAEFGWHPPAARVVRAALCARLGLIPIPNADRRFIAALRLWFASAALARNVSLPAETSVPPKRPRETLGGLERKVRARPSLGWSH